MPIYLPARSLPHLHSQRLSAPFRPPAFSCLHSSGDVDRRTKIHTQASTSSAPSPPRIVFAAGGTGGHVFPAVAIADAISAADPGARITFVGTRDRLEWTAVPKAGYKIASIPAMSLRRPLWSPLNLLLPLRLLGALAAALRILWQQKPNVVVGTGGYVSFPTCIAAFLLGIPVVLQEQNALPGLANLAISLVATRIYVAFEDAAQRFARVLGRAGAARRCALLGNPVRSSLLPGPSDTQGAGGGRGLKPTLLVLGGSLGAAAINWSILASLPALLYSDPDLRVVWQTGPAYHPQALSALEALGLDQSALARVRVLAFVEDMAAAYRSAALVVSRAGAITCSELLSTATPSVLVPSPNVAEDHQTQNARALVRIGAAEMLQERDMDPDSLVRTVRRLLGSPEALGSMRAAARDQGRRTGDAAAAMAGDILRLAARGRQA